MATVVKNFRIKSGLIVEGTSGTIGGHNILTESTSGDQYILNLVGGATLVKSVGANLAVDGEGQLSLDLTGIAEDLAGNRLYTDGSTLNVDVEGIYDDMITNGIATVTNVNNAIDTAATDATNKANQALADAQNYSNSLATNYDPAGSASSAQTAAQSYTDSAITNLNLSTTYDAYGSAATAEQNAKDYADDLINDASTTSTNVWSAYKTSSEIGVAVSNLVDSAPELLDTLNELAAAIADNPNYATDMAANLAAKQNTLTAGTGITLLDDEISVTANTYDGYGAAADAQAAAALDATDKANTAQSNAEATAQAALDDVLDSTTPFTDLNINDVAKQVAATTTSLGSVPVTAYQFNHINFRSGKFLVKIDNGTNNEISEILVTLDSSNNVAITEYAIVGTNGTRGTITADIENSHCRIRVTPVDDSTIAIAGTVFNV
jgi:hypothetical protein